MLPTTRGSKPEPRPAVLLNPGLEMIFLARQEGTWRPDYPERFLSLGLVPPGPKLRIERPLPGAYAWLADDLISVTVASPSEAIYETSAAADVVARARELGKILFFVTHFLNPAELYAAPDRAWQQIAKAAQSGRMIGGCVAVAGRDAKPAKFPKFRRKPRP